MIIAILKIGTFFGWTSSVTYIIARTVINTQRLARENNLTVPFKCKTCHSTSIYTFDQYLDIVRKPRNTTTRIRGLTREVMREYKFFCSHCQKKTWQQVTTNPFSLANRVGIDTKMIAVNVITIFAISSLAVITMTILDKLS